jgi:hypothetical protein
VPISPIDLQVNIGQSSEVARVEHAHSGALSEQLHHLAKESDDRSKTVDSRLEESREAERMTKRLDDRPGQGRSRKRERKPPERKEAAKTKIVEFVENGNLGNIIDIRK